MMQISKARRDGLSLLFLGMTIVIFLLAYLLGPVSSTAMQDFRVVYNPARCMLRHCDPYQERQVQLVYQREGAARPSESEEDRQIVTRCIYPPSAFAFAIPFATLPWEIARRAWTLLSIGSLLCASFLVWDISAEYAPVLAGALAGLLLANSEVLIILGNPSGIVISLTVAAAWCFIRRRFVLAGVVCMAIGLAVKPQVPGLIWLYFLLASSRSHRRNAVRCLLTLAVLSLPVVLWVWSLSPNWINEWRSNLHLFTMRGAQADVGPATSAAHGAGAMICLQTVFSIFRDSPRFYDPAAWAVCTPLLVLWMWVTVQSDATEKQSLIGLAAIAPLSLLPVYHHMYDAKLLLLTIPGCSLLWKERGAFGRLAVVLTSTALILTGDLPSSFLFHVVDGWSFPRGSSWASLKLAIERVPVPLILLAAALLYLFVYLRGIQSTAALRPEARSAPEAFTRGQNSKSLPSLQPSVGPHRLARTSEMSANSASFYRGGE
jgi:hypothetical protein